MPVRPLISYYGGKQRIASKIAEVISTIPHTVYEDVTMIRSYRRHMSLHKAQLWNCLQSAKYELKKGDKASPDRLNRYLDSAIKSLEELRKGDRR